MKDLLQSAYASFQIGRFDNYLQQINQFRIENGKLPINLYTMVRTSIRTSLRVEKTNMKPLLVSDEIKDKLEDLCGGDLNNINTVLIELLKGK